MIRVQRQEPGERVSYSESLPWWECRNPFLIWILALAALLFLVSSAFSQTRPPVNVKRFEQPPVIDGRLEENEWMHAAVLTDFYQTQPGDNSKPSHPTEVLLGYDNGFLYLGIRAVDEAGQVRATVAKRDDFTPNSFHWLGEALEPDGKTWRLEGEFRAVRIQ